MGRADGAEPLDALLTEQVAYYRARAPEYEADGLDLPGGDELVAALESFKPGGRVLELACGPGTWTPRLVRHADSVTAVDAAPEMLAIASTRSAATTCASSRPICSAGTPITAMTWSSSASGSLTFRWRASRPFGRWWPTASNRAAGCSSSTTRTEHQTS